MSALLRVGPLFLTAWCAAQGDAAGGPESTAAESMPPAIVTQFCGDCHRGPDADKGFDVDDLFAPRAATAVRERAATALQRVRARSMPPVDQDAELPDAEQRVQLLLAFADVLPPDPDAGVVTMRRLSRREYEHTVQDLCGVSFAAASLLPEDPRAYGFDNVGDVMTVSPLLFEQYFAAADAVATAMLREPAARARLLDGEHARGELLRPFLARAFRRPATDDEVRERAAVFDRAIADGLAVDAAIAAVLRSILASPLFLFRVERGTDADASVLTPHELATRLAYLLTSSLPDARLQELADRGELARPEVLRAEARRLVQVTHGRPLAEGFAAQWLRVGDVLTMNADFRRYPQIWNGQLRPAFYEEAMHFCAALFADDERVTALLDADHTFLNETLSKHYAVGDVHGAEFVRVPLIDRRRGGVLGMGAVLMVTSYPLRTSPVLRGRWILDTLLDEPPAPPPPNAGRLPADDQQEDGLSLRARLERHRREPSCANCHARMDPLGFALENWDVLGLWRDAANGQPIDCRAELPDGTRLDGPIALKDALLARERDFARAFAGKLMVYAIGRPLVPADERELLRIAAATAAGDYRFTALLEALVTSPLFTRRTPGGER